MTDVLVLLDINMPVMNGWAFLDACKVKKFGFHICVIIVTSSLFNEDCEKAKEYDQIIGYYTKPLKQERLKEVLRKDPTMGFFIKSE